MELADIKQQIREIFVKEKVEHVFLVDDRVNSLEQKKPTILAKIRQLDIQEQPELIELLSQNGVDVNDDEDIVLSEIEKNINADNIPFISTILKVLKIDNTVVPGDEDNDAFDIHQYFNRGQFTALEPSKALDTITEKIQRLKDGGRILVLFDLDLTGAGEQFATVTGVELLVKLKDIDSDNRCLCSIFTHLAKTTSDEIARRKAILESYGSKLNRPNLFVLAKKRKNDSLLFGDGIKKVVLSPYYENIKEDTLKILQDAFSQSGDEFMGIDTYEFDHIISHASNIEGVWAGETLLRIFNVILDKNIKRGFIENNYAEKVNPFFERAIKLARNNFPIGNEDIPEFNRNRIRNLELYVDGSILNPLYEPINNGDIFQIKFPEGSHHYILVAQECDIILRSNGRRNRKNDFFTLLRIDFKNKEQIEAEIEKFTKEYGRKNHYLSNKFLLNNFSNEDSELIGVVDFKNELVVYASILDLVAFNSSGEAKFNLAQQYPINSFCQALRNRFNIVVKICDQRVSYLNEVDQALKNHGLVDTSSILRRLVETISPTNKTIGNLNPYNDGAFDFGVTRSKRLKTLSANRLLEKYGYYLSRPAELPEYADDIDIKAIKP